MHPDIPIFPGPASSSQPTQQTTQRPTDRRVNVYPQQPFPPSATSTAGLFSRAEANPNAPINFIRKIQPGGSASPSTSFTTSYDHNPKPDITNPILQPSASAPLVLPQSQASQLNQDDDAEGEDESRESTPASPPYPRPGNGLMAKLPPDDQDLEWLVGEGEDEAAFSHVVFGAGGDAHKVDERAIGVAEKV
jgi:succinate---hydroxymethylglutarate CoA-transferase